jgi:hypothetical protein
METSKELNAPSTIKTRKSGCSGSACFSVSLGGFSFKVPNIADHVDAFTFAYFAASRKRVGQVLISARDFVFQVCDFLRNRNRLAASDTRHTPIALQLCNQWNLA